MSSFWIMLIIFGGVMALHVFVTEYNKYLIAYNEITQEEIPFKPPEAIPAAITDPFELWIVDSKTTLEYGVWLLKQAEARENSLAETIKQGIWTCDYCHLQFAERPISHNCKIESHRAWMTDIDFASRRAYCHRCGVVNFSATLKKDIHYIPLAESNEINKDRLVTCADCKLRIPDTQCFYYGDTRKYHCKPATCRKIRTV